MRRAADPDAPRLDAILAVERRRGDVGKAAVRGADHRGLPQRTVRLRLTALYGGLFLVSGTGLLAITYLLVDGLPLAPATNYQPPAVSGNGGTAIADQRSVVLHALLLRSGIALAIMAVVSVWLGWLMAGRALRPLRLITARTRQISEDNLHERLALSGPSDEVTELSDTIDGLLGRLDGAFAAQRSFVASVSHELRTPLAMMRTSLDVAAAKPRPMSPDATLLAGKVREGLDQADRLVESFLVLAGAQGQVLTDREPVSLPELVRGALATHVQVVDQLGLTVRERLDEADVTGNNALLARLVANIVDNAVRHNEPEGFINITTGAPGPVACLTVESGGRRIEPEQVAAMGQPFRRIAAERTGSDNGVGLGLAIVAAIATAHGGTLDLQARPTGGLTVIIVIPRAKPSARPDPLG